MTIEIEDVYPMSDIEKGMLFHTLRSEKEVIYHDQFVYPLPFDPFDEGRFRRAMALMINKHSILRTGFNFEDYVQPLHIVATSVETNWDVFDISAMTIAEQRRFIQDYLLADRDRPFDIARPPLWRICLFRTSATTCSLAWIFHHAILDGWSNASFITELNNIYLSLASDPDHIPELLKSSYKDYVIEHIVQNRKPENIDFWRKELADFKRLDMSRLADKEGSGGFIKLRHGLGDGRLKALKATSLRENISLKNICFAAYVYMLAMLTYDNEFTVGLVTHCRPVCEDGDKILGCFLNTIPVKLKIPSGITWREFVHWIDKLLLRLKRYDGVSLVRIKEVAGRQDAGNNPFFDSAFDFTNFHIYDGLLQTPRDRQETSAESPPEFYERTNTLLDVDVSMTSGQFYIGLSFSPLVISRKVAARLILYYSAVLDRVYGMPEEVISKEKIMPPDEKELLLSRSHGPSRPYDYNVSVHHLLEEHARRTPDAVAVVCNGQELTCGEVNRKANRLARYLHRHGLEQDKLCGILMERSATFMIAILAIWKAGGAYVPLDAADPGERNRKKLGALECRLLLTNRCFLDKAGGFAGKIICVDETEEMLLIGQENGDDPRFAFRHDSLAYVMFTSGSTGTPKGVMVEHAGMMNHMYAKIADFGLTEKDIVAQNALPTFDISVWQFFATICTGGKTVIYGTDTVLDPRLLIGRVEADKITVLELVPSYLAALLEELESGEYLLSDLRFLLVTGEELRMRPVKQWFRLYPGIRMANVYGPTEASDDITHFIMEQAPLSYAVPVGRPIQNLRLYILDSNRQLCPPGVAGEISISGIGVGRGYINEKKVTEDVFGTDPFDSTPSARMYRTGDLGHWTDDGNIVLVGRIDNQTKINGRRIEPDEIAGRILEFPGIREAVVLAKDGADGNKSLHAYYSASGAIATGDLRSFLSVTLPEYLIPSRFVAMDKLPLKPNGKIDRGALPEDMPTVQEGETMPALPRNPVESDLLEIWKAVLGKESIGIHDNFFLNGGDSIKTILIQSRLKKKGYKIRMGDIFEYPTIAALSGTVVRLGTPVGDGAVTTGSIPLTPVQHHFFRTFQNNRHHFNQAMILYSPSGISREAVMAISAKILGHHDALRISFPSGENGPIQQYNEFDGIVPVEVYDLRDSDQPAPLMNQIADAIQAGIDMEKGPLIKIGLFHRKDGDRLLIVIHHLVIDGISWRILLEDIATLFDQWEKGQAFHLPEKTDAFGRWSQLLTAFADSGAMAAESEYWRYLKDADVDRLPKDISTQEDTRMEPCTLSVTLEPAETSLLLTKANEAYGTHTRDLLLAALVLAIGRSFGIKKILMSMEGHGREDIFGNVDVSRTVGWFTSIYPVYMEAKDDMETQLIHVKDLLHRMPDNGIGFGILRYLCQGELSEGFDIADKAEISFDYLGQVDPPAATTSLSLIDEPVGNTVGVSGAARISLEFNCVVVSGTLWIHIAYNGFLYRRESIASLAENYSQALSQMIRHCCGISERRLTVSDFRHDRLTMDELEIINNQFK